MRLERAIEGYWLARRRNLSPATVRDYSLTFRRLMEHVGEDCDLETITAADINELLNRLREKGLAQKTILNAWIALSSLWTWAAAELGVAHIMREVDRPKARRPPIEPYSEAEVRALLAACDVARGWDSANNRRVHAARPTALRDKLIMLLMLDTGIRVSELCTLVIGDYNQRRGQLIVRHGKGDKGRILFVGESTRRYLWRYLNGERENAPRSAPIFVTRTGKAIDRYAVQKMIARAGERAGVRNAGPHRFRHTFAINALRNGMNILEVKELLGHESLAMVQNYARIAAVDLERAQRRYSVADRWGL